MTLMRCISHVCTTVRSWPRAAAEHSELPRRNSHTLSLCSKWLLLADSDRSRSMGLQAHSCQIYWFVSDPTVLLLTFAQKQILLVPPIMATPAFSLVSRSGRSGGAASPQMQVADGGGGRHQDGGSRCQHDNKCLVESRAGQFRHLQAQFGRQLFCGQQRRV